MENAPVTLPSWKVPQGKNVTKPKKSEYVLEGGGWKKKEKKDLEFPARCLRTLRLPPGQSGPMKWESQADLLSQTLFS